MGRCDTPKENIEKVLHVRQTHFPEQPIDWGHLLNSFVRGIHSSFGGLPFEERMQFLVECGLSEV